MGNYIFSRQPLVDALVADARRSTEHDFGRSIIPEMVPAGGSSPTTSSATRCRA